MGSKSDPARIDRGEPSPRTQTLAIGAPGSINPQVLTEQFEACLN
jgi:hypothetical protein